MRAFVGAAAVLVAVLAGCGAGSTPATPASSGGAAATASARAVVAAPSWGHVHHLALDGDRLLIGTHEGLWQQRPGQQAQLVSDPPFDVMGLAATGPRMLASGHPAEGQDLPSDLGLRESTDGGSTWREVSLQGQVDFHRLGAVGDVVVGLASGDARLLRSSDGGRSWIDLGTPGLFDLALDPDDPEHLVATTPSGPVMSADGGATFTPIAGAPLLALLAWTTDGLYGVTPDGVIHASRDDGASWQRAGAVPAAPGALTAAGSRVLVATEDSIVESTDGGVSFTPRIEGLSDA